MIAATREDRRSLMASEQPIRREVLRAFASLPLLAVAARWARAGAEPSASAGKVETEGLVASIKFEAPVAGLLADINGKYKLRVTELTLAPGGRVGEHNHVGPGIRQVTAGQMTYILPDRTIIYGPGDFFFEAGDVNHTVLNRSNEPNVHL